MTSVGLQTGSTYAYSWDELGRLSTAMRTDPGGTELVQLYTYDTRGQRVGMTTQGSTSSPSLHTVQVFDSLVLKNAIYPDASQDYQHDDTTEALYLGVGGAVFGRAFIAQTTLPSASAGKVHVFMPLGDPLGSTSFVGILGSRGTIGPIRGHRAAAHGQRTEIFR